MIPGRAVVLALAIAVAVAPLDPVIASCRGCATAGLGGMAQQQEFTS